MVPPSSMILCFQVLFQQIFVRNFLILTTTVSLEPVIHIIYSHNQIFIEFLNSSRSQNEKYCASYPNIYKRLYAFLTLVPLKQANYCLNSITMKHS